MIARLILFAQHCDVVVSTIHSRSHEVSCACVASDIFLIDMLFMYSLCNEHSVRCEHKSAHFCIDSNIAHACRNENALELLSYALTDCEDVVLCVFRSVADANTA